MKFFPQPHQPEHEGSEANHSSDQHTHWRRFEATIYPEANASGQQDRSNGFEASLVGAVS
jgi:hypothetical protein